MHIKVLGPMTKQCELLLQNAAIAAKNSNVMLSLNVLMIYGV